VVADGLAEQGFQVEPAATFATGLARLLEAPWDLVILDVALPGGSGFDLCRRARAAGITTPILMLTARDAVADRVTGLEVGADDYLVKPFAFAELVARLRALARRPASMQSELVQIGDLDVDLAARTVSRAGLPIPLTAKEWTLLEVLARHAGRVVDRPTIAAAVWDENHDPFTNVLEVLVRRLRRKIDDGHPVRLLETVRGAGYRLGP
jgi:two-component system copper resistance phosphate regulon response regulator CusR